MRALVLLLLSIVGCGRPAGTVVRVDFEPPGANCPEGGSAIHTGRDDNKNGELDESEVDSTQFVCNGASQVVCSGGNVVKGTFTIQSASDASELSDVDCIEGDLLVVGTQFTDLSSLSSISIITGDVVIAGNDQLASLTGLEKLRDVGRNYLVQGNGALASLAPLGQVRRASQMTIIGNDTLPDLRGLDDLRDLNYPITIANNSALASLAGFDNLVTSSKTVSIRGNRNLASVDALAQLRAIHILEISGSSALTAIALPALEKINARLIVTTNDRLDTIALSALTTAGDFLRFEANAALRSIDAPVLVTTSQLFVETSASLETFSAPRLALTAGTISFNGVPRLRAISFGALSSIGESLIIRNAGLLPDMAGFPQLTSIGGSLEIIAADTMTNFNGLGALEVVFGNLTISNNARVRSFTGFDALNEVGNNLTISQNPMLSSTTAQQFANRVTVGGTTTIN